MTSEDAIRLLISFSRFTCLNSEASEISSWNAMGLHLQGKCYGVEMTRKGSEKVQEKCGFFCGFCIRRTYINMFSRHVHNDLICIRSSLDLMNLQLT